RSPPPKAGNRSTPSKTSGLFAVEDAKETRKAWHTKTSSTQVIRPGALQEHSSAAIATTKARSRLDPAKTTTRLIPTSSKLSSKPTITASETSRKAKSSRAPCSR